MSLSSYGSDPPERDQRASSLTPILERFCRCSCALSAVVVDGQGEAVDYFGLRRPFDLRLGAAEGRMVLARLERGGGPLSRTAEVCVRAAQRSFLLVLLSEGYALVAELPRHAFGVSPRALGAVGRELQEDSGLQLQRTAPLGWAPVRVRTARAPRSRPAALWMRGRWLPAEVLGTLAEPPLVPGEAGYRLRVADGAEVTVVHEPGGYWFAEPHSLLAAHPP